MARKPSKALKNSAPAQVAAFADASGDIAPPAGVELETEAERVLWRQFSRARARADWREFDLVLLAKVVSIEAELRELRRAWKRSGPLVKNKRETLIENPLLRVIDTLQRQQLAVIRSMSLTQLPSDPRTVNASAQSEAEARRVLETEGPAGLLALPVRH